MKVYTRIVINMRTLETVEAEWFEYHGPVAMCDGAGDPSGDGGAGQGSHGGMAGEADVSGLADAEAGQRGGRGRGSHGGMAGEADVSGLAAAESMSLGLDGFDAADETSQVDENTMAGIMATLQDPNRSKSMSTETLAKGWMAASRSNPDMDPAVTDAFVNEMVARGVISQAEINARTVASRAAAFVIDSVLNQTIVSPVAQMVDQRLKAPVMSTLAKHVSIENTIASQTRQDVARSAAARALGLPDPVSTMASSQNPTNDQAILSAPQKTVAAQAPAQSATPSTNLGQAQTTTESGSRPTLGMIGRGRQGDVYTGSQGVTGDAPTLKRNTLLGG